MNYGLYICPECNYTSLSGVSGGVGSWPGDGKVRCPSSRCEYRTVMESQGRLVYGDAHDELCETASALAESLRLLHGRALRVDDGYPMSDLEEHVRQALRSYDGD